MRFLTAATLVAAFMIPVAALAQQTPAAPSGAPAPAASPYPGRHGAHGHHRGGRWLRALSTLNLSASQKQQIDAAIAQTRQANQNADPQTRRDNMTKLRARIDGILTPAQRTQLQAELHSKRREHRMPLASPAPTPSP